MTDESKARTQMDRGQRAERVLNDPLVKEAFDKIRDEIVEAWENSDADDDRGRHNAYLLQRLLRNFESQFKQIVRTGEAAKRELLEIEKESRLKRATRALKS